MDFLKQTNFRYIVIIIIIILAVINLCKINSQENFMNLLEDQNLGTFKVTMNDTNQVMFGNETLTHKLTNLDTLTVAGYANFPGGAFVKGEFHSTNNTPEGGRISLMNPSKSATGEVDNWTIYNMTGQYQPHGLHFWKNPIGPGNGNATFILTDNGDTNVKGELTVAQNTLVKGDLTVEATTFLKGDLNIQSTIRKTRENNSNLHIVSDKKIYLMAKENVHIYKCRTTDCETWDDASGNLTVEGNLTCPGSISFLPRGCIIMFNGGSAPAGWAVCNGENGTPDLRERFVLGAGVNKELGNTGGTENVTLTEAQMPRHNHGVRERENNPNQTYTSSIGQKFPIFDGQPGHHFVNSNDAGSNQPHTNMPPYYVLLYIMKL
jgi:microcystin-dependent protein